MSLNYNLSKIKNYKEVCFLTHKDTPEDPVAELVRTSQGRWFYDGDARDYCICSNPVTDALIWLTIDIDLGSITTKNVADFYLRVSCVEKMIGARLRDSTTLKERPITLEDVQAHIGLSVNVADRSWGSFSNKLMLELRDRIIRSGKLSNPPQRMMEQPVSALAEDAHTALKRLSDSLEERLDDETAALSNSQHTRIETNMSKLSVAMNLVERIRYDFEDEDEEEFDDVG